MSRSAGPARWRYLLVGLGALVAASAVQHGMPYLVLAWRADGLSLAQIGLLVSAPLVGLMLSLIVWGGIADRFGERLVLTVGLAAGAGAMAAAAAASSPLAVGLWLVLAGAATASVYAASGRLVLGWFPARQRGLAMGIRQTGQPIGVGIAALTLPGLAAEGTGRAFAVLAVGCAVAALLVALLVRDPARPTVGAATPATNPYRAPALWRLHVAGGLLVVPQFAVAAFAFDFLVRQVGWGVAAAGALLAAAQGGGALSRIVAGVWSDRVRSRFAPLRAIAVAVTVVVAALSLVAALTPAPAAPALAAVLAACAAVVTVSPNGVAFTSVAEHAGSTWAGRALGVHNTVQHVFAITTVPLAALLIDRGAGYASAFALGAVAAIAAVGAVPRRVGERFGEPVGGR